LVRATDCVKAASVPHENPEVGVQDWRAAGALPVQFELSTVVPSERVQTTVWDWVADKVSALHEPVRD
jgi:hypothetical protein